MDRITKRIRYFGMIYLSVSTLIIFFLYPIIGFYLETGTFSLYDFLFEDVHGNFRLTFGELIFDVDFFLANFLTGILFCLILAFFFVYYYPKVDLTSKELNKYKARRKKLVILFGSLSLFIILLAIIFSYVGLGPDRPQLSQRVIEIMFTNYHLENFSKHVFFYLYIFMGFPGIFYLIATFKDKTRVISKKWFFLDVGIAYFLIGIGIIDIFILVFPINTWLILHDGSVIREILFSLFDSLFISGLILLMESKELMSFNTVNASLTKKINDSLESPDRKKPNYYKKHFLAWLMSSIMYILILGLFLMNYSPSINIGSWFLIARCWYFAFMTFFTLFLRELGIYLKIIYPNIKMEANI
ncbi:MAG: hypothetical protein ACTSWN_14620 [Promethearchaeota archaeon]